MSDFFISYAREDQAFVRRLHEALSEEKRQTWVDWQDIPPTAEWLKEIYSAIEAADAFVFVISPAAINSRVCQLELDRAVNLGKRLIPIVCQSPEEAIPEPLAKLNWVLMRESDDFARGVAELLQVFDTDIDWVRAHTRLLVRANEWDTCKRDASFLLRGSDLANAERWIANGATRKDPVTTALQTQYLFESRRAATKRQRRTLGAVGFALALAIGLAIWAYVERGNALYTLAQSDFFEALKLIEGEDTPAALAYLARALRNNPAHNGASARVHSLLSQRQWVAHHRRVDFTQHIIKAAFLPDHKNMAIASRHGLWALDLATHRQRHIMNFAESIENIRGISGDVIVVTTSSEQLLCDLNGRVLWSERRRVGTGPQITPVYHATRDGFFVASAEPGGVLYKQLPHGNVVHRIQLPDGSVQKLDFSEDGGTLLIHTDQGSHLINLTDGSTTGFISDTRACRLLNPCRLSPDGTAFVYEHEKHGHVVLKDLKSQNHPVDLLPLIGGSSGLFDLSLFSPNGEQLLVAAAAPIGKTQIQLFRSPSGDKLMERILSEPRAVRDAAYHPSGDFLAVAGRNDVLFFNTKDLQGNSFEPMHFDEPVMTVSFHPTADLLLTVSGVHVDLWDIRRRGKSARFQIDALGMLGFEARENKLYLASPGMVKLMDLQSGSVTRTLPIDIATGHLPRDSSESTYHSVAKLHALTDKIAIPKPGRLEIYDLFNGHRVTGISVPWKDYWVRFSKSGNRVVAYSRGFDRVLVLDVKESRFQWLDNLSQEVHGAALSSDGKLLALCGHERIEIRSLPSGDIRASLNGAVIDADFSTDGKLIIVHHIDEGQRGPKIWTANLSTPVSRLFSWDDYHIDRARFSDNGELVIFEISRYFNLRDTFKGVIVLETRSFQPVTDIVQAESISSSFAVSRNSAWTAEFDTGDRPYEQTGNTRATIVIRPVLEPPSAGILSSLAQIAEDTGGMRLTSENVLVTIDPSDRKRAYTKLF
jgi:WD40 repeat protein